MCPGPEGGVAGARGHEMLERDYTEEAQSTLYKQGQVWWYTPVTPASQESEREGLWLEAR
jgi:hypothetical protein